MSNQRVIPFLAASCVGLIASSPAFAQPAEEAAQPADATQQSSTQDEPHNPQDRRDIIVTGDLPNVELETPRATAPLIDTPQTVTVISDQTLRRQNLLTLRDALQTVPGITFGAGEGGGGYGDSINLRGFSANNDITIDGIRDVAQYSRTDPFNLQQIEVYNGANSVFGGSGSLGGTINIVSKVPQADTLTIVQAGVGTDNYYRGTIDSNVRVSDLIAVRLNGMYHENDFPGRDVESYQRWGIAPSIAIGVGSPTTLTISYVHQEDDNTPVFGVPYYAVAGGPLPGVDDSSYFGIENLDRQEIVLDRLTAIFSHNFNENVTIRNLTRWQRVEQPSQTSAPQGTFCLANGQTPLGVACPAGQNTPGFYYPSGPRGFVRDQLNQVMYNQTDLRWTTGQRGGVRNTLVIGASYMQEDYEIESGQLLRLPGGALPNPAQPPISIANPNTVFTGPVNYVRVSIGYGDTLNYAVYAFDTLELGELFEISGGVRWERQRTLFRTDNYTTPATGAVVTTGATTESDDNLFSYRGGIVFHPIPNASLYASYASTSTPSAASVRAGCTAITTCATDPEEGRLIEFGGKIDLLNRRLQLTASVFRNERSNYRVASNDPILPTLQVTDGQSRVDGIALGATGNITPRWTIFANYTYLDAKILQSVSDFCLANPSTACGNSTAVRDPQSGNRLQQTPEHSASLFTTYSFPFGLQVGYGFSYQGSFALNQSSLAAPTQFFSEDYLTHRLFASYSFANGLTAQVNVQNVSDERYFTGIRNNGWATPGEARSAVLSLYYSF